MIFQCQLQYPRMSHQNQKLQYHTAVVHFSVGLLDLVRRSILFYTQHCVVIRVSFLPFLTIVVQSETWKSNIVTSTSHERQEDLVTSPLLVRSWLFDTTPLIRWLLSKSQCAFFPASLPTFRPPCEEGPHVWDYSWLYRGYRLPVTGKSPGWHWRGWRSGDWRTCNRSGNTQRVATTYRIVLVISLLV